MKLLISGIEIEYVKASPDNLCSIEMKRAEKLYERKQYSFPIYLLEPVEKESKNYQLVDEYNFWFCNH